MTKRKPIKHKYQKKCFYAGQSILEISGETKRKNAYIKIAIPNELASELIATSCASGTDANPFPVTSFYLEWNQLVKPKKGKTVKDAE